MNDAEQQAAPKQSRSHQKQADRAACDHRSVHRGLDVFEIAGAEERGYHNRASNVAAKGKGNEDQRDLIAVAHRGQGVFPDQLSGDQRIRDIIELLKQNASK